MWSRNIVSLLMTFMPIFVMAQDDLTTIQPGNGGMEGLTSEQTAPVRIDDTIKFFLDERDSLRSKLHLKQDSLKKLQMEISDLKHENNKLRKQINQSDSLSSELQKEQDSLRKEISTLKQKNDKFETQIEEADESLERIVYNFLYIYYEAYSIKNIAIPAYKSISNDSLRNEVRLEYTLLENYGKDVHELCELYKTIEADLVDEYTYSGTGHISKIEGSEAYKRYSKSGSSNWGETYLGKNMLNAISILRNFTRENRKTLKDLIADLERCIATEKDLE